MQARDLMTTAVLTVAPDTPVKRIAELLLAHGVSAVPVVEADGTPIGIISETDLVARSGGPDQSRHNWCVGVLAGGGGEPAEAFGRVDATRRARDVMSAPLVSITEQADLADILRLLTQHHIKRLPVTRGGRIVGIVSRADLLRALASAEDTVRQAARPPSLFGAALARIDRVFHDGRAAHDGRPAAARATAPGGHADADDTPRPEQALSAKDFRSAVARFKDHEALARAELRHKMAEKHKHDIEVVLGAHMSEDAWRHILLGARIAAEHGETEYMALRIPRETTSDNGRAINVAEAGWPATLRGEGAELYHRFQTELAPRGFQLVARTLEFPDGIPGDIGLILVWGGGD